MSNVKRDVQDQTRVCFNELCGVIDNVAIIKIIPDVIITKEIDEMTELFNV